MKILNLLFRCMCFTASIFITPLVMANNFNCSELTKYPISPTTKQVIVVTTDDPLQPQAYLISCEYSASGWKVAKAKDNSNLSFAAIVGESGIAKKGDKVEGDNKTPSGVFYLGEAFGYNLLAKSLVPGLKMDYRYITDTVLENGQQFDKFIDDSNSPENNYNSWVIGPTTASSYENMYRKDGLYEYGVIINYNMNPAVPGKGSAIFFHIWGIKDYTAGCVAIKKPNLINVLKWLDKTKQPQILILRNTG